MKNRVGRIRNIRNHVDDFNKGHLHGNYPHFSSICKFFRGSGKDQSASLSKMGKVASKVSGTVYSYWKPSDAAVAWHLASFKNYELPAVKCRMARIPGLHSTLFCLDWRKSDDPQTRCPGLSQSGTEREDRGGLNKILRHTTRPLSRIHAGYS